ncbi:PqqD family protein (plasmid) [Streptomyces scopuliridis]|uniref:PqqD family protein n=1 Tax=Streptomyces scopuliridis TaxID=452529 RepID=UPI002DDABC81|nr:PqqD family protein [Streptomyces scopuliridis]WSB39064.1 PqqD family protein [Streptomyces scopuliridis]
MDELVERSDSVPRRVLGIRIRRMKDDFLIGDEDRALLIEDVAAFIFASLDGRRSTLKVAQLVAQEYGVDEEQALADVVEFLGDLTDQGIVEW